MAEELARDPVFAGQPLETLQSLASGAVKGENRKALDSVLEKISQSHDPEKIPEMIRLVNGPLTKTPLLREKILHELLEREKEYPAEQRIELWASLRPVLPGELGFGLEDESGLYETYKAASERIFQIAAENPEMTDSIAVYRKNLMDAAWRFGDYTMLEKLLPELRREMSEDPEVQRMALIHAVWKNDLEDADKILQGSTFHS